MSSSRLNRHAPFQLFTQSLLRWYRAHGRVLPWRQTLDPYAIWVSEIMLQQTQVATVLPYYHRFLSAFPTVHDLASAPLEKVLKAWEGLGYYARARNLHGAATEIVERFGGNFPSTFDEVLSLPGIGRSTAGAILTIALGQRHPILDGNVRRVLCRYFAVREDPKNKETEKKLWEMSERLLPRKSADLYTQAIMDLGATLCTPGMPRCPVCPVRAGCKGYQEGIQADLPVKGSRKKSPHYDHVAGIVLRRDQVLIRRRPLKGLLGGLWEFPEGRVLPRQAGNGLLETLETIFEKEVNLKVQDANPWLQIEHVFTHFRMTLHVFICRVKHLKKEQEGGTLKEDSLQWVSLADLEQHPFSSAHQKIAIKLTEKDPQERLF